MRQRYEVDSEGFVHYGEICHGRLDTTTQYGAYYISGHSPYPKLSDGLRFKGRDEDYHSWRLHKDDVEEFVRRVKKWEGVKGEFRKGIIVLVSETRREYFFSTRFRQPMVPGGFVQRVYRFPTKIDACEAIPDGILTCKEDVIAAHFVDMKEIPNPSPERDPHSVNHPEHPHHDFVSDAVLDAAFANALDRYAKD